MIVRCKLGNWMVGFFEMFDLFLLVRRKFLFVIYVVVFVVYWWIIVVLIFWFLYWMFELYGLKIFG